MVTLIVAIDYPVPARILVDAVKMNILGAVSKSGFFDIVELVSGKFGVESLCSSSHTFFMHITHRQHCTELVGYVNLVETWNRKLIEVPVVVKLARFRALLSSN